MRKAVSEKIKSLGVGPHLLGYEYLREAIELVLKDESYLRSVTKRLYPEIAIKHDTTATKVERSIRHAIHTAPDRGNDDAWNDIKINRYAASERKPTNSRFIASVADYLSLNEVG